VWDNLEQTIGKNCATSANLLNDISGNHVAG
jgi:hypothetical protein